MISRTHLHGKDDRPSQISPKALLSVLKRRKSLSISTITLRNITILKSFFINQETVPTQEQLVNNSDICFPIYFSSPTKSGKNLPPLPPNSTHPVYLNNSSKPIPHEFPTLSLRLIARCTGFFGVVVPHALSASSLAKKNPA